ncbi:MAG: transglutaminase-like domain-containing protein [Microgenomates group bacterium]
MFKKFLLNFFLFIFVIFVFPFAAQAADYQTDYKVEYNLFESEGRLNSLVNFDIKITNLRSDVYVSRFSLTFPKTFLISNLKVFDDQGEIIPKVNIDDFSTKINVEFNNPNIGKNSVNNLFLRFNQVNLFKINGNIWEVALPVIDNKDNESYQVIVNLPLNTNKKISISKPKPSLINNNQIIWNNPKTRMIYAVFGDQQIYETQLYYHLKNPEVFPVSTEIALPPDTLYQKIFLESLEPLPSSVYQDEDGNFLAKYILKPKEEKTILFKGKIVVYVKPQEELLFLVRKNSNNQKKYLLNQEKYWQIKSLDKIDNLRSPEDIYYFVTNYLQYDYKKVNSNNKRLGAQAALMNPENAVCLEFTDLFVAAAREKGIMAREIEGYGFSYDSQLQPLSLITDVLHSWPEYYDDQLGLWRQVDPTWENTSGIDYFSSFDLNHITFVIHGKRSDYPVSAGNYKMRNSRDVLVKAVSQSPQLIKKIVIDNFSFSKKIFDNKVYDGKLIIQNKSNVYLYALPIKITGKNIVIKDEKIIVDSLAPFEKKQLNFQYQSQIKNRFTQGKILIFVDGNKVLEENLQIYPALLQKVILMILAIGVVAVLVFILKRKNNDRLKNN